MDAFGDDFSSVADVDPAAEFLAREQEALAVLDDDLLAESVEAAEPVAQSGNQRNINYSQLRWNSI